MANPILHSDIIKDDGAIDAMIAKLEKLEKEGKESIKAVRDEAAKMAEQMEKTKVATEGEREEIGKTAKQADKLEREYKALNDALSENGKKLAILREGKKKANQIARAEAKLVMAAEGSYNQLSAKYSLIKIRLNEMSKAQRETTEEGKKLEAESKALRKEMNRLQTATGNTALNVGNYKDSIKEALEEMNNFSPAAGGVVGGAKAILKQFKLIIANPLVLVLGAVLSVLGLLGSAFLKSEKGAKLMEKAGASVNTVMTLMVSIVNDIIEGFEDLFSGGIVDGFKKIGDSIVNFGGQVLDVFGAIFKGDFATAAVEAAELWQPIAEGMENVKEKAKEVFNAYDDLAVMTRKRREENVKLTKSLGAVQEAEAVAQMAANDSTLSFRQQLEALNDLEAAQKKRLQIQIQIARNNLSTITQEVNIRKAAGEDVLALMEQQAAALEEVQALETEYTVAVLEGEKLRREIRRDEFERDLDFAIDFYDSQKTLLERQATDQNKSFEERRKIYSRLVELDRSAFAEQQKLLEDYTGAKLNLNELALIDDERVVRERLKQYDLDDVTLGRILETLRDRKAATQDILDLEQELTAERNKQNQAPELLEGFDFDEAGNEAAAERVAKIAKDNLAKSLEKSKGELVMERLANTTSIYDLLGIDFGNGETQIKSALDFAKEQLFEFASFRTQIADQNVENANREVEAAEAALARELENQTAGSATRIATREEELERAKETQAKALDEQRKAQRNERRLQTIQQATNLVTASAKIWGQLGFPFALPAIGIMWGSFISAKVRAAQLAKSTNRKGTYLDLDFGDTHESGNDIPFGVSKDGKKVLTAERGESMAVFNAGARRKYGSFLPQLVDSINRGVYEEIFAKSAGDGVTDSPTIVFNSDNKKSEGYLKAIARNTSGKASYTTDAKGRGVRTYKNERTIINN